jgi:hypothetical protein
MRITHSDPQRLTIVDFPYVIGLIAWPCAAFMAGIAIVAALNKRHPREIVGPIAAALMFFFGGAVFTKRSEFNFDFVQKNLTWRRRGLFTNTGGIVPLEQITRAAVESHQDDSVTTYRVVLKTAHGSVPLTDSYASNRDTADRIRTAINDALKLTLDTNEQIETDILDLALAGRKIDAIALARQRYGYDLTQAKQFVEGLTR